MNLRFGHDEHFATAATRWLIDRGIKVSESDAPRLDRDDFQVEKLCHLRALPPPVQVEKLCHLRALPPPGFFVSCLPAKTARASAAWWRAVAILGREG